MLRLLLLAAPLNEGNYVEPDWFAPLMQINDRYGFIIWPAVGLTVVGAIAWGLVGSMRHKSIPGEEKFRCKKEIVSELRRQLNGLTLDQIARMINHDKEATKDLLAEMTKDGMLSEHLNTKGATVYRLKGVSG
jgi:hypothetical protein